MIRSREPKCLNARTWGDRCAFTCQKHKSSSERQHVLKWGGPFRIVLAMGRGRVFLEKPRVTCEENHKTGRQSYRA